MCANAFVENHVKAVAVLVGPHNADLMPESFLAFLRCGYDIGAVSWFFRGHGLASRLIDRPGLNTTARRRLQPRG
jgi:hypothetical protein